jgi:hypothetical protein
LILGAEVIGIAPGRTLDTTGAVTIAEAAVIRPITIIAAENPP